MLRIGITGGIASGKSEVAKIFATLDVPIIDADVIAHQLTQIQQPALALIKKIFGDQYLLSDGSLNRNKLRQTIFSQDDKRQQLEAILHPLIRQQMIEQCDICHAAYGILVIPLLFETTFTELIDRSLVIDSDTTLQLQRASQRDNVSKKQIQRIIEGQISRAERNHEADDIIHNNGDLAHLKTQVKQLDKKYRNLSKTD